jgi:hypothetical protein
LPVWRDKVDLSSDRIEAAEKKAGDLQQLIPFFTSSATQG